VCRRYEQMNPEPITEAAISDGTLCGGVRPDVPQNPLHELLIGGATWNSPTTLRKATAN
jgi:hypothetical protein